MMKKLLLDINSIVPNFTIGHVFGVGRSTQELINAFENIEDIPFKLIYYSQNLKGIGVKNINTKYSKQHIYLPHRKIFSTVLNKLHLKKLLTGYDLLHIPHNTDDWEILSKTIYTIHDLIVYRYPKMWGLTDSDRRQHKYIADNCKAIVTCSQASKTDICNFLGCPPEKVTVIPWGVNRKKFHPDRSKIDKIPYLGKDFFFSASCNHPRKQPALIIDAFKQYCAMGGTGQLVLLGPTVDSLSKCEDLIHNHRLIVVEGISDSTLVKLYTQAKASIIVSLYEGFGLPVLESLACHTQVICAHNSSLIEAGGDIVDYIYDFSPKVLSDKMISYDSILKSNTIDIVNTENHLDQFSWDRCARAYIDFWEAQLK